MSLPGCGTLSLVLAVRMVCAAYACGAEASSSPYGDIPSNGVSAWETDYGQAAAAAEVQGKMLFIFFSDSPGGAACRRFEAESLADPAVRRRLQECVCVRLPLDATVSEGGKDVTLLKHGAFSEMSGGPGIAIIDYAHKDSKYYGYVVSAFPITGRLGYTPRQAAAMLDLPAGTITQRTLIWAVRTHPEGPASTQGEFAPVLAEEAESHSQYQANIRVQGHHGWGSRFLRILGRLPRGLTASEVCAESWPGENLVEAAVDCVQCWRSSSGHWSAVRARHPMYGYDMKRGRNGIWYATGIFGRG